MKGIYALVFLFFSSYSPVLAFPQMQVSDISGALPNEIVFIRSGLDHVNTVLQSDCFKNAVLASNFTENQNLSGAQIYALQNSKVTTVKVVMYTGSWWANHISHTIGDENEPSTVYMNRYYVKGAYMVGDNLIHEGEGHSLGFTHYHVKSTSEPYGMNAIYESCAPKVWLN
jgi:hypothetical protein